MMKVVVVMIIGCMFKQVNMKGKFYILWAVVLPKFSGNSSLQEQRQYSNINSIASRNIKGEMVSLPASPKTLSLKLPMMMMMMMMMRMIIQV